MPKKKQNEVPAAVIGLDLATCDTGWAIVDKDLSLIDCGLIHYPNSRAIEARLYGLIKDLGALVAEHPEASVIAIEDQFLGKAVTALKALSQARGAVVVWAYSCGLKINIINNKSAKKAASKKGNATKEQVREKICEKYNLRNDIDENITDAIAIAWAYYSSNQREEPNND
jgi:crossover junction endodeoxyribonuclease RuvC